MSELRVCTGVVKLTLTTVVVPDYSCMPRCRQASDRLNTTLYLLNMRGTLAVRWFTVQLI